MSATTIISKKLLKINNKVVIVKGLYYTVSVINKWSDHMLNYLKNNGKKTRVIAHRGASFLAKRENTMESFELAI